MNGLYSEHAVHCNKEAQFYEPFGFSLDFFLIFFPFEKMIGQICAVNNLQYPAPEEMPLNHQWNEIN